MQIGTRGIFLVFILTMITILAFFHDLSLHYVQEVFTLNSVHLSALKLTLYLSEFVSVPSFR